MGRCIIKSRRDMLLIILWLLLIFNFSDQIAEASRATSGGIVLLIRQLCHLVHLPDAGIVSGLTWIVRKFAHFFLYLVLGIQFTCALSSKDDCDHFANIMLTAFLLCLCFAVYDEIHQSFVPGRSGEIRDICIDCLGSLCGIVPIWYGICKKNDIVLK